MSTTHREHVWRPDPCRPNQHGAIICAECQTRARREGADVLIRVYPHYASEAPSGRSYDTCPRLCDGERLDVDYVPSPATRARWDAARPGIEAAWDASVLAAHGEIKTACERGDVPDGADPDGCADVDTVADWLDVLPGSYHMMDVRLAESRLLERGELVACTGEPT